MVAVEGTCVLFGHSEAASRIEHAMSWNDVDRQNDEYGADDEEYYENDVERCIGDDDDELEELAHTVGPPTDDPECREQFDGNLVDAEASTSPKCMHQQVALFKEARELLSGLKSARGYLLVFGIGAFDGLAQPSTECTPAKFRGKGKKGKKQGWKVSKPWYTWSLATNTELSLRTSSTDVQDASERN